MEPRPHERGNWQRLTAKGRAVNMLQWSHVLTNVETSRSHHAPAHRTKPLQWSHVLTNVETRQLAQNRLSLTGFNGATSSRTWKQEVEEYIEARDKKLQWSHVLTNVETQPRDYLDRSGLQDASMEPRPHERGNVVAGASCTDEARRFNGATSSRTWKPCAVGLAVWVLLLASMEPRPHERGNACSVHWRSFRLNSFNGATSSRTWKPELLLDRGAAVVASMEPRPHERGNQFGMLYCQNGNKECFNGATSSRTWKLIT